jgi:hypothetical protein
MPSHAFCRGATARFAHKIKRSEFCTAPPSIRYGPFDDETFV